MRFLPVSFLFYALFSAAVCASTERVFEFTYQVLPTDFPVDSTVDLYVPVPADAPGQRVLSEVIDATLPVTAGSESVHGNRYYRLRRDAGSGEPVAATFRWTVARSTVTGADENVLGDSDRALYLQPNQLVPVGHEVLTPIQAEIYKQRTGESKPETARAIYDWIVDNVEYKKVGTGWGNGDTFWACNERYGNCTDFHALFISLARSEDIPARFEIGFPVPADRAQGEIKGYHCWVKFYLPGSGWLPIDASEAAKHPELREQLYGSAPADRILFTTGRDLVLEAGSKSPPLNYFIYPYAEVAGQPWREKIATRFTFREVNSPVAYNPQSNQ